ncbi:MAG: efflux RND transporter periplasmic adaptor subunit [Gammaproteobacteria bacterium]|nr:efflux RND transporter periplasmic adaptor subunit [Gammaproteobacteria bacterium]
MCNRDMSLIRRCVMLVILCVSGIVSADSIVGRVASAHIYRINPGISGEISQMHVEVGDQVEIGTLLAELENTHIRFAVDSAKSKQTAMMAELEESKRSYERDTILYEEGSLSRVELDLSELTLLKSQMSLNQSKADYAWQRFRLTQSKLMAPQEGVIVHISSHPGERVTIDHIKSPVISLASSEKVVVAILKIDDQNIPAKGDVVSLLARKSTKNDEIKGKVASVDRVTKPGFATIRVFAETDLPEVGRSMEVIYP